MSLPELLLWRQESISHLGAFMAIHDLSLVLWSYDHVLLYVDDDYG